MIRGTPVNITIASHVWADDPELAWIDAEVIEIRGTDATIVTSTRNTEDKRSIQLPEEVNLDSE